MTEIPRPVELSALFKGENAKLLQGKTLQQLGFLETVVAARIRFKNGDGDALRKVPTNPQTQQVAKGLTRELAVIHKAVSIPIDAAPFAKSVLDMHGELKLGEVNNPEGTF